MGGETIQAKYEEISSIAARFRRQAELNIQMQRLIQRAVTNLQNNGWEGKGATAFFAEMQGVVLPTQRRLHQALITGDEVLRQIVEILRVAEEEAARPFQGSAVTNEAIAGGLALGAIAGGLASGGIAGGAVSGAIAGGAAFGPMTGDAAAGVVPGARAADSVLPRARAPQEVFSEAYYDQLVTTPFKGTGSAQLNQAMETLASNPSQTEINRALDQIAVARGLPRDAVQANYERYLELRAQAEHIGRTKGQQPVDSLDLEGFMSHGDFMGRTAQLRYGKVVGDVLGIDPVFGALLNPTGGLVGPGNAALDLGDRAVSYHGAVHDAAGYLYNYHDIGPGYNYLGLENRDTSSPLTGQEAGLRYWNDKLGTGPIDAVAVTFGMDLGTAQDIKEIGQNIHQGFNQVRDWFTDLF